jgi:hypothetical protein
MKPVIRPQIVETVLVIGGPPALAVFETFHPHSHDLFPHDLRTWLLIHYHQIPLFPSLAHDHRPRLYFAAAMCRVVSPGAFRRQWRLRSQEDRLLE